MKIGIDARQLSHAKRHGQRTYVENLVKTLSACDRKNQYVLYVDAKDPVSLEALGKNFKLKVLPWHRKHLSTLLNDMVVLPFQSVKDKIDVMHYPSYPAIVSKKITTIVTIHDAIPFMALKVPLFRKPVSETLLAWYNALLIKSAAQKSHRIITISKSARHDLMKLAGFSGRKMTTIHLAANAGFKKEECRQRTSSITRKYGIGERFILGYAHKNGLKIIRAFQRLPSDMRAEYRLGLINLSSSFPKDIKKQIDRQGDADKIVCIPPVPDEDLPLIYNAASVFVYPSYYEGFGLPVIEAMQCGCPVICSNRGSLPEIAGNAAIYVTALDDAAACAKELADKIKSILLDRDLRTGLIQKGFKQARQFCWQKVAADTLEVYESAYGNRS